MTASEVLIAAAAVVVSFGLGVLLLPLSFLSTGNRVLVRRALSSRSKRTMPLTSNRSSSLPGYPRVPLLLLLSAITWVLVFVAPPPPPPPPPAVTDGRAAREAWPGERDMTGSESATLTDGATETELSLAPTVAAAAAAATASFACRTCLEAEEEDFGGN